MCHTYYAIGVLREHRGDGHMAALKAADLDPSRRWCRSLPSTSHRRRSSPAGLERAELADRPAPARRVRLPLLRAQFNLGIAAGPRLLPASWAPGPDGRIGRWPGSDLIDACRAVQPAMGLSPGLVLCLCPSSAAAEEDHLGGDVGNQLVCPRRWRLMAAACGWEEVRPEGTEDLDSACESPNGDRAFSRATARGAGVIVPLDVLTDSWAARSP